MTKKIATPDYRSRYMEKLRNATRDAVLAHLEHMHVVTRNPDHNIGLGEIGILAKSLEQLAENLANDVSNEDFCWLFVYGTTGDYTNQDFEDDLTQHLIENT